MNKRTALFLLAPLVCALSSASASIVTINGTDDIYGAGHTTNPGGTQPSSVTFASGATFVTFSSVTGTVTLNGGGNYNDPDGVGSAVSSSSTTSYDGLSGITSPGAGELVGVFETGIEPMDPAPASLDFTSIGTNFTTLSPLLNQTFYIGDGLTGDGTGTVQQFVVPAGATQLFLGIADAGGYNGSPGSYGDNGGMFTATFNVVPEPSTWAAMLAGAGFLAFVLRRQVVAQL